MTELQDVQQQIDEVGRKAAEVQQRIEAIRPAATSPDGAVTVTVSAAGTLEGIKFGAAARSMDLDALGAAIMRTATEAHRIAAVQTQDALADLTGRDSTAVQEMGHFIPPQDPAFATAPGATGDAADTGHTAAARPLPVDDDTDDTDDDGFAGRGLS